MFLNNLLQSEEDFESYGDFDEMDEEKEEKLHEIPENPLKKNIIQEIFVSKGPTFLQNILQNLVISKENIALFE